MKLKIPFEVKLASIKVIAIFFYLEALAVTNIDHEYNFFWKYLIQVLFEYKLKP